jgi:hypothetical protein
MRGKVTDAKEQPDTPETAIIRFAAAVQDMETRKVTGNVSVTLNMNNGEVQGIAKIRSEEFRQIRLSKGEGNGEGPG